MNLSQLEENFKSACIKGDWADIVQKAVVFSNGCQEVRKYDAAIVCLNKLALDVKVYKKLLAVVLDRSRNRLLGKSATEKGFGAI